jgi:hypothetical protein
MARTLLAKRRMQAPGTAGFIARTFGASLPAVGTALLPKLTCPLCWHVNALTLGGCEKVDGTTDGGLTRAPSLGPQAIRSRRRRLGGNNRRAHGFAHTEARRMCLPVGRLRSFLSLVETR